MHLQWAQWQVSSQGLYGSLLRLQTPAPWTWEQGSQGATSQPRLWTLVAPCAGRHPWRSCILASMKVLSPDLWLFLFPPLVTLPQTAGDTGIHGCHTHLSVSHQQLCGFCLWARGEGQEQHHCSPEPGTSSAVRLGVYLMHTLVPVIFFIFVAGLLATWVAKSPCMRMATNCFNFQVDSGSTWWQEKVITKTFTRSYSNIFKIYYIPMFTKNLIIFMIFYNLCSYGETSKSTDFSQKSPHVLQKTYKISFHYS